MYLSDDLQYLKVGYCDIVILNLVLLWCWIQLQQYILCDSGFSFQSFKEPRLKKSWFNCIIRSQKKSSLSYAMKNPRQNT